LIEYELIEVYQFFIFVSLFLILIFEVFQKKYSLKCCIWSCYFLLKMNFQEKRVIKYLSKKIEKKFFFVFLQKYFFGTKNILWMIQKIERTKKLKTFSNPGPVLMEALSKRPKDVVIPWESQNGGIFNIL